MSTQLNKEAVAYTENYGTHTSMAAADGVGTPIWKLKVFVKISRCRMVARCKLVKKYVGPYGAANRWGLLVNRAPVKVRS